MSFFEQIHLKSKIVNNKYSSSVSRWLDFKIHISYLKNNNSNKNFINPHECTDAYTFLNDVLKEVAKLSKTGYQIFN